MTRHYWTAGVRSDPAEIDDQEIDLRALMGMMRRRMRLVIATFSVVVVLAALVLLSLTPKYTASVLVLVDPAQKNLLDPGAVATTGLSESARVDSEVEIIRSDATLLSVIDQQKLVSDPEFGVSLGWRSWLVSLLRISEVKLPTGEEALHQVLSNLRGATGVTRRGTTNLIEISADSRDPKRAADLANAVADAYIAQQVQTKIDAATTVRDILQRRLQDAQAAMGNSEERLDQFVFQNLGQIIADTGDARISGLRDQISQLQATRDATARLADVVSGGLTRRDWTSLRQSLESDAAKALYRKREALEAQLSHAGPGDRSAIDLAAELASLDEQLANTAQIELSGIKKTLTDTEGALNDLRGEIRTAALNSNLPASMLTTIYGLQQDAGISRSQYQALLSRLRDVEIQADMQVADSRIVSPAIPPEHPSFPKIGLSLMAAGLLGAFLGVGLAYLRENYVGGFVSERQAESVLRVPVAASVPRVRLSGTGRDFSSPADMVVAEPISVYAESIRRIRASVDHAPSGPGKQHGPGHGTVLMVTSAVPGEGKSSLALALGRTYAISGKRAILIDCDLRKPSVHRHLNIQPTAGLYDYLSNRGDDSRIGDFLTRDPLTPLTVATGLRPSAGATDHLVMGATFDKLLDAAVENFEIVILDAPPIGPIVDGLYLARRADVILMVVQWAHTSQDDVRRALASLETARPAESLIEAVLNGSDAGRSAYGGSYSGYFEQSA